MGMVDIGKQETATKHAARFYRYASSEYKTLDRSAAQSSQDGRTMVS